LDVDPMTQIIHNLHGEIGLQLIRSLQILSCQQYI